MSLVQNLIIIYNSLRCLLFLIPVLTTLSCAGIEPARQGWYDNLFDPDDKLRHFLVEGEFAKASHYYNQQKTYFSHSNSVSSRFLESLANVLNQQLIPLLQQEEQNCLELLSWPAKPENWQKYQTTLTKATAALASYEAHSILRSTMFTSPVYNRLTKLVQSLRARMVTDAGELFFQFGENRPGAFLQRCPVQVFPGTLNTMLATTSLTAKKEEPSGDFLPLPTLTSGFWKPQWPFDLVENSYSIYFGSFEKQKTIKILLNNLGIQEDAVIKQSVYVANTRFLRLFLKPIENLEKAREILDMARQLKAPATLLVWPPTANDQGF